MAKKNAKSGNNGKAVGQDQAGREIDGSNRSDILIGSRRDDVINGRGGSDLIIGGNGNDQISGGGGSDLLLGGNGDDVINGGRGSDTLIGGRGDDILNGGAGNDLLIGGAGNDVFNGGAGNDTIIGGAGENTVILSGSVRDYSVEMGRRSVTVSGEDGTDTLSGIEVLSFDDATVYLDGRNNGPLLDSDVSVGIEENGAATINALVRAFDFDGDTLTLVSVDAGEFAGMMSFDPTTGEITLDPGAAYDNLAEGEVVTFTLSYTVSDGTDTSTGEMTIQITGSNDAPIVTPIDAGPVSEDGGLLSVDLMATASDVDSGDTIGIEEIQSVTSSNPDRSIVWGLDPNNYDAVQLDLNQFTDLQEGETETVTISYVVGDNRGGLTTNTATFTVVGTNDLPTYVDFTTSVSEDSPLWVNLLASVEDVDSDTVVATDVVAFSSNPDRPITANVDLAAGTVIFPSGQFEDLAEGQTETLTITFNLDDGDGGIVPRQLSFTVIGQNDAPIVTPIDAGPVSEDGGLLSVDLMATASDVDSGDTIGIEEIQSVTSSNPDRSIVWGLDPNNYDAVQLDLNQFTDLQEGETETVTISYVVGDNRGGLTTNTATFTVVGTNDLPTYVDFTTSVSEDSPLWVNLLASVEDVDSDTVVATDVVAFSSNPDRPITANVDLAAGTVIFPSGQFEDLAEGQTETLTITFNLDDGDGGIVPRQLSFTVIGSNDAPYIEPWNSSLEATLDENDAPTLVTAGTIAFEDVDNGDWQQGGFTGLTLSGNAGDLNPNSLYGLLRLDDFAQDGSLGWVFTADSGLFDYLQEGESVTLTYDVEITDGRASDTTQVSITIEGTNDLPTFVDFTISLGESEPLWVNLLASVEDVDSDTVVVSDVVAFTDNPDRVVTANVNLEEGTVTFPYGQYEDLAEGETEILTIQFNLDDGDGGIVARELQFTVIGQNDAPYFEPWNSDLEADAEAAGDGQLSASGVIGISDPDASDIHTGSTLGVALSGDVGDLTEADVIGLLSFAASGDGPSVAWSFDAESALFSQLTGSLTLTYEVEISDGHDSVTAPVTITITPQNAAPDAPDFDVSMSEDSFFVYVDLLEGASDADGDNLSVVNVVMETSNPNRSFVYNLDESSGQFTIYPGNFQDLSAGETETITLSYDVEDGQGGVTPRTVTITVDGANDAVTIYDNANLMFGENDAAVLSESGTWSYSDVDANDTYTATVGPIDVRGNGAGLAGVDLASLLTLDAVDGVLSWSFDADASVFDYLDDGDLVMVNFIIELSDGASTSTTQISLMVTGADDLPSVSATLEATTSEDDAPLSLDLLTHALDPEGDSMAVTGVTATTASGAAVAFTVDALTGELVIDPAQFGGLAAGETETITVNYGVANADTVITGGSDSIPTIGNAGRWFVVNFDTGQVVEEARSSGNSAAPYAEPANGVVFHFNGNNADYGISASVYVDGVATVIPPEEFDIEGYFGSLTTTGQWISFANSISNATISWTGTVETPDGPHEVSVSFDGLNFVDNQVGNSTLDSWSVEVSGPTADAIAVIEVEGRDEGASMMAKVFSKTEAIDPVKTPVADDVADTDADDGFLQLSHDDGLAVMTAGDVAEFSFDRVFDLTNFRGAAQFASLTETGDAGMELASVRSTPGQAEAFDLPGLDAFGLPQDDAALALPVPDMPEGW